MRCVQCREIYTPYVLPLLHNVCVSPTLSRSFMVSVGVSALGTTSIHFVEPGVKVNGHYYQPQPANTSARYSSAVRASRVSTRHFEPAHSARARQLIC